MAIRTDLGDLYTPVFDRMTLAVFEERELVCETVFDVVIDDSAEWKSSQVSGLGPWQKTAKGQGADHEDPVQGYDETFTPTTYTKGITIPWEDFDDDEYVVLTKIKDAKEMGRGSRVVVDQTCADHLNNAFDAGGSYDGPDSVALCEDHPTSPEDATTLDNSLSGAASAFSHDALETMEIQIVANLKDMKGQLIDMPRTALLVGSFTQFGPFQRVIAERAGDRPDTFERDINVYSRNKEGWINYQIQPWTRITTAGHWFVIFPELNKINGLKLIWRQKPEYYHYIQYSARRYVWDGWMRFDSGWDDWRPVWGSVGS